MSQTKSVTLTKALPWIFLICGVLGLILSFIIMYEKLALLANPAYRPSCSLNPVVSCGSVMASWQSHVFGFPNPLIGLMAFPVVIATGVAMLAGATLKRWYWLGLLAGTIFGLGFVHWLFFQSVYRINALCPYCIGVWIVTITTFWYTKLYLLEKKYLAVPKRLQNAAGFARRHHLDILVLWFLIITALILKHFWYYFGKNF